MCTDEKILEILKQSQEEGAKLLVRKYYAIIRSVCAKKLKNEEDIQECVNDVFAEFCLNYTRYDKEKSNLKNYLCTIAERRAIDRYRLNCRNEKIELEVQKKYKDELTSQENQAQTKKQLDEALDQLETLDKAILKKHYYEGLTYGEIAEELDMKYENVKKRGLRGKKKLLYYLLLGLLIVGITACTAVVMKKYDLLPEWFPFYDWILPDAPEKDESNTNGLKEKIKSPVNIETNHEKDDEELEEESEKPLIEEVAPDENGDKILKKYQFSSKKGYIWSDEETYSLVKTKNMQSYEKDGVHYEIEEAIYSKGLLEVYVDITCLDEKWLEEDKTVIGSNNGQDIVIPTDGRLWINDLNDEILERGYVRSEEGSKCKLMGTARWDPVAETEGWEYIVYYKAEWKPENEGEDIIYVTFALNETMVFDLVLTKTKVREYEEEETVEAVGVDIQLQLGPAMTDGKTAIVYLEQRNIEEYKITNLIGNSYYGLPGKQTAYPYLTDAQGNSYTMQRILARDNKEENTKSFEIYYPNVAAGEYTLEIPYLCLQTTAESEVAELQLPTGEDPYLECDVKILFADGSGYHIKGLTRSLEEEYIYNVEKDGTLNIITTNCWYYEVNYEVVSTGNVEFSTALACASEEEEKEISSVYQKKPGKDYAFYIKINSEEMPESAQLKFTNPVYILNEAFSFPVTIRSSEE
ncbi:MAG: RNA polymerase sigma factor [Dorea sp.]